MSARAPTLTPRPSASKSQIPSLARLGYPTSRNDAPPTELQRVREALGMDPLDTKDLLKELRQNNPRRSSSLVPTKPEIKPIPDPEPARRSSSALTLNQRAVHDVPSPFDTNEICDLVSWYSIHHSKEDNMDVMLKAHNYRTRAWDFIAERMSYSHYGQKPIYHEIADIDKVGDTKFKLRDYSFKYIDVGTNNEIVIKCNIFNGSKALAAGSKSTRTP